MPDPWPSSSAATGEAHADEHPPAAEAAALAQIRSGKGKEPRADTLIASRTGFRCPARAVAGRWRWGLQDRPSRLRGATWEVSMLIHTGNKYYCPSFHQKHPFIFIQNLLLHLFTIHIPNLSELCTACTIVFLISATPYL